MARRRLGEAKTGYGTPLALDQRGFRQKEEAPLARREKLKVSNHQLPLGGAP